MEYAYGLASGTVSCYNPLGQSTRVVLDLKTNLIIPLQITWVKDKRVFATCSCSVDCTESVGILTGKLNNYMLVQ